MTSWGLTVDCASPARLAGFWAVALGYASPPPPDGFATWEAWLVHHDVPEPEWDDGAYLCDPAGAGPTLSFLRVPESKTVKNRLHLDVKAGGGREMTPWEVRWPRVEAEVDRLVAAGASVIRTVDEAGRADHVVLADPEGNEFCVV